MRKESFEEGCSMSERKSGAHQRRVSLKPRRKLPFGENISSTFDTECPEKEPEPAPKDDGTSLTPRRNTPLSERQQIALLCKLSVEDNPSNECSPSADENCASLKRNERGETSLHLATIKGDYSKVHSLLKQGFNVNTTDYAGWTPLHEACNHGWLKIAKLLLQFDADVNVLGLDKYTPLHDAATNQHEEIVKLLLKYGADPLQENAHRRTPLDIAGSERIAKLLSEAIRSRNTGKRPAEEPGQSAPSPSQPTSASCELTMRKNSPQNQTHKGADKPTSPRFTLKFQTIRSSNDKSCGGARPTDVTSPQPKYPSYCVTMETKREDDTVSSSTTQPPSEEPVTSTTCRPEEDPAPDTEPGKAYKPCDKAPPEKMDTTDDATASKVNGGRSSVDSNTREPCGSDTEKEDARRKRRKSSDSSVGRSGGKEQKSSPKTRKRGSQSSSDTESNPSDADPGGDQGADNSGPHSPKVPPLKIVIPSGSSSLESETRERSKVSSSKPALPYVVNTTTDATADTTVDSAADAAPKVDASGKQKEDSHPPEERFQRVTRSSQRMQAAMTVPEPAGVVSSSGQKGEGSGESSNDEQVPAPIDVHPRKRKLRQREADGGSQNLSSASSGGEDSQQQHQQLNSYQMFLNIRKQVDKRRKGMFIVQPKPPQGFKDYLLNRCSYVLEGNAASRLSVPMISPPQSLEGSIKELFIQQEKERYRLRLQHLIEREKLVLSVEQETLRVHGRGARAMANQTVPLSACTILKDEEIYNVLEDDKDKNIRSRYNGRLFLSWLQDVNDKWKKIKELMLLRHHNEAESLHAVQKLDWEWKMKELSMCDMKTAPVIDDIFVPMVHVNDEFELLPPANP